MALILTMDNQATLKAWATVRCDVHGVWPRDAVAMAVVDDETGNIRAVWVMVHTYSTHCDVHLASDGTRGWATRNTLGGLFGYIFYVLGATLAIGIVGAKNTAAQIAAIKLGFEIKTRLPEIMDNGDDGVMIVMHRDQCQWIKDQETDHG